MKLKYGQEEVQLPLSDKNILQVLNLKGQEILSNPEDKLRKLLKNPLSCTSLEELILKKKAQKILIMVNDITRPTP
ncbi:MAG: DUF2088 domain-containing protein, partial [Bacteroidetes bacterium]|nr:DUF2088 domain-containing protein [Bacteroidota bacterium]